MRFIVKIFLFIIIFQAFLFLFSTQFGMTGYTGEDISAGNISGYQWTSKGFAYGLIVAGGGLLTLVGIVAAIATKNVVWFGAGLLSSIMFGIWMTASQQMGGLLVEYEAAYYIWTIINIITWLLMTLTIVELFTGRSVDD